MCPDKSVLIMPAYHNVAPDPFRCLSPSYHVLIRRGLGTHYILPGGFFLVACGQASAKSVLFGQYYSPCLVRTLPKAYKTPTCMTSTLRWNCSLILPFTDLAVVLVS
ncbi:hypothetical protein CGRA01v4_08864 [Colletotrichum graminicola]|nr:hypothetical protein CGRA01v4_08864 [Colletotrichum graminicola]